MLVSVYGFGWICANLHENLCGLGEHMPVNADIREWISLKVCEATCESMWFGCNYACENGCFRECMRGQIYM